MKNNLQKLKIALSLFAVFIGFSLDICLVNATEATEPYLSRQNFTESQKSRTMTLKGLFMFYFNSIGEGIPDSYKFIELKFLDVPKGSDIYDALQKGVYLDLIKNKPINLGLDRIATQEFFSKLVNKNFELNLDFNQNKQLTLGFFLESMIDIQEYYYNKETNDSSASKNEFEVTKIPNFYILNDAYLRIKNLHYDSDSFKDEELLRGAIKGLADSTGDKYTTYFPPVEAKNFNDELSGEFEGIGAHVDMEKPGIMMIIAPIVGSPAEKAGILAGDQVIKIDDFEVTDKVTLQDAVNKIKGKSGTQVKLLILRNGKNIEITVTRAKIIIDYVSYKKLDNGDNYIQITTFGFGAANTFSGIVANIAKSNPNAKTIIDLRNDPGGSLDEVATMLDYFVPKLQSVVNIKYKNLSTDMNSNGAENFNFLDKKVIILINKGSASASEIMAGTIKDYLKDNVKIIGETSYGKGSVQTLDSYEDGSSLKYTIAKWFTGKTKTGIDGIGIKPDIEIKTEEGATRNSPDKQLDYAKNFRF